MSGEERGRGGKKRGGELRGREKRGEKRRRGECLDTHLALAPPVRHPVSMAI